MYVGLAEYRGYRSGCTDKQEIHLPMQISACSCEVPTEKEEAKSDV